MKGVDEKELAVVIPIYRVELESFEILSLKFNQKRFDGKKVFLVAPNKLKDNPEFTTLANNIGAEEVFFPGKFFEDILGYNKLMLNFDFYNKFNAYEYILICQLDALLISENLESWTKNKYDYVGAPWVIKTTNAIELNSVGNGGFSLRRVRKFLEVLSSKKFVFRNSDYLNLTVRCGLRNIILLKLLDNMLLRRLNLSPLPIFLYFFKMNEDFFWSFFAKFFVENYSLPDPEDALLFSFELHPRECLELTKGVFPVGCHAWQRYDRNFWEQHLPELLDTSTP